MFNTIRFRLSMIAAIPLLFALVLTAGWLGSAYDTYSGTSDFDRLVQLSIRASAYIHETQKERGATGVFMGSDGARFDAEMVEQRKVTDTARAALREYLSTYDASVNDEMFGQGLAVVVEGMEVLDGHRTKVDSLSIPANEGIAFYTDHNAAILSIISQVARLSYDSKSAVTCAAYESFLRGKEQAGIERAVMSMTFADDHFELGMLQRFASLVTAQNTYFDDFLAFAPREHAAFYDRTLSGSVVDEVQRMRNIAFAKGVANPRTRLHARLLGEFSFGGLIHNFKNYVLRYNPQYAEQFQGNYERATRVLDELTAQAKADNESERYAVIQRMLDDYQRGLATIVDAHAEGKTVVEIDRLVKVDDGPALAALAQLTELVSNPSLSVDPGHWFNTMTKKINLMKEVEDRLAADLLRDVSALRNSAHSSLIFVSLIATSLTLIVLASVFVISNRIVRPVVQLSNAAKLIAQGDLTQKIENEASDEIGELARCFNGMVSSLKALVADLEDRQRALQMALHSAEDATRSKSEFLANMSHEIRTPMTAILGYTENLLEPDLSDSDKLNAIHTVRRNGEHLLQIINDILDISKIEAGKVEIERIQCSPVQVVADVKSLMQVRADAKDLSFNIEYVGVVPETIASDPTRLKQILVNLVGNAIKFTDEGGVRLLMRFVEANPNVHGQSHQPMMQFDIIDSGIGMTPEQMGKLFKSFSQADTSTTRKFGGTGLGLMISKRLAGMLGGNVTVFSEPGEGSTFRVTINTGSLVGVKMLDDPTIAAVLRPESATATAKDVGRLDCRILMAEDGPDNQRLIGHILKKAGAEVTTAVNGKLAVDAAMAARDEGNPFDLILMDMQMPVMDGYEATGLLRQKGYTGPIIALTAHAMAGEREKCIKAGCDDYAMKPIDRKKLIDLIFEYVHHGRSKETIVQTETPEQPPLLNCRILLAEDNLTNQVLVVGILKKAGAEIIAVKDGKLALDAALAALDEGNQFDIILMDIQMPLMGGDEATNLLREQAYTAPIIALTAHAMDGDREKYLRIGFNDYATKPIHRKNLVQTIQKHFVAAKDVAATVA